MSERRKRDGCFSVFEAEISGGRWLLKLDAALRNIRFVLFYFHFETTQKVYFIFFLVYHFVGGGGGWWMCVIYYTVFMGFFVFIELWAEYLWKC